MKVGDIDHWSCGKHSGIPECCIRFFIGPWAKIYQNDERREAYWDIMRGALPTAEYIVCPRCIAEKRVFPTEKCECGE